MGPSIDRGSPIYLVWFTDSEHLCILCFDLSISTSSNLEYKHIVYVKSYLEKLFVATLFWKTNGKEPLRISHLGNSTEKLVVSHK